MSDDGEISSNTSAISSSSTKKKKRELCVFFVKVGSCRHGEKCSRVHINLKHSKTILLQNFYPEFIESAKGADILLKEKIHKKVKNVLESVEQKHFEEFYTEIYVEISLRYGNVKKIHVCQNVCNHMRGNVYIQFHSESDALCAVTALNNRWFAGRAICAQLSPVVDFSGSAVCRQFEIGMCDRGHFCNFLHLRQIPSSLEMKAKVELRRELKTSKLKNKKRKKDRIHSDFEDCLPNSYSLNTRSSTPSSSSEFQSSLSPASDTENIHSFENNMSSEEKVRRVNTKLLSSTLPKAFLDTIADDEDTVRTLAKRRKFGEESSGDSQMSDHELEIVQKAQQIMLTTSTMANFEKKIFARQLCQISRLNKMDRSKRAKFCI